MAEQPEVDVRLITPGYLSTMRMPLYRGRDFNAADVGGRPGAVLVSQSMAKHFWPNEDPIGKQLTLYFSPTPIAGGGWRRGRCEDGCLKPDATYRSAVFALAQITVSPGEEWRSFGMDLAVRTHGNPPN